MKRKMAALLVLVIVAGLLGGCWNYREVESLNIVAGFAIDKGYEGHKYHLTIDIANASGAGKDKPVATTLVETEGDTIFDAVRNVIKRVGYKLYWPDCQIAVISKDVAQESILPVVDFLMRDAEPRLTLELFISQEKTAKEILMQQSTTMSISSFEIDKQYELNEQYNPVSIYQVLYEDYNTLASPSKALTLPALSLADNLGAKTAILNGTAIFKRDTLMGYLTAEDSKYFLFATDMIKGGVLNVKSPEGNAIAALEIFSNKTDIKPMVNGDTISFSIHTQTDVALDELDTRTNFMENGNMAELKGLAEKQLEDSIGNTIRIVEEQYGQDVFGFGELLHQQNPEAWSRVSQNWGNIFKTLKVDVTSQINIRDAASQKEPVKVGG